MCRKKKCNNTVYVLCDVDILNHNYSMSCVEKYALHVYLYT